MSVNLERYYSTVGVQPHTFLSKWGHNRFRKYYNKWKNEIREESGIIAWGKKHRIKNWWMSIPKNIESLIICGPKIKYSKNVLGKWTYIDRYHLYSRIIRNESNKWKNYRMTLWDKIRFYIITGYKYENV